ncbi:MAG: hypothetical protein SGARI_002305 [Bacillariaceae sp.]
MEAPLAFSTGSDNRGTDLAVKEILREEYSIDDAYHDDVLKSIQSFHGANNVTVDDLESLGKDTIEALAEAAKQSQAKKKRKKKFQARPSVPITVKIPHLGVSETLQWQLGESLLHLSRNHQDMLGQDATTIMEGACGGNASCSTCHVYIYQAEFQNLLEEPTENELDMIDLAFEPKEGVSRLGCQVRLSPQIVENIPPEGLEVEIPKEANNLWDPDD